MSCLSCSRRSIVISSRTGRCSNAMRSWRRIWPPVTDSSDPGWPSQPDLQPAAVGRKAKKPKKSRSRNAPALELAAELKRISGVDLTSIDGIDVMTAQTILSELGTDLNAFPTENRFASWLGLTPSKDISGGKVIGRSRRRVQNRVTMALRMAATTLLNSKSYLGADTGTCATGYPATRRPLRRWHTTWRCWSTGC